MTGPKKVHQRWLLPAVVLAGLACIWLLQTDFVPAGPSQPEPGFGAGSDWDLQWSTLEAGRAAVSAGELPHWDPFPDYGSPVLAHPEAFVAHPAWLLGAGHGPATGLRLLQGTAIFVLFLGFAWLAVELELPWLLGPVAAASVIASFEWENRLYSGHLMFLGTAYWPVCLAAVTRALRPGTSAGWAALGGGALGLASLGGGHYPTLFGLVLVALYIWASVVSLRWLLGLLGVAGLALVPVGPEIGQWVISGVALVVLLAGLVRSQRGRSAATTAAGLLVGFAAVAGSRLVPGLVLGQASGRVALNSIGRRYGAPDAGELLRFNGGLEGGLHLAAWWVGIVLVAGVAVLILRESRARPLFVCVATLTLTAWGAGSPWTLWPLLHLAPGLTGINYPLRLQWVFLYLAPLGVSWLVWANLSKVGKYAEPVIGAVALLISAALLSTAQLEDRGPESRPTEVASGEVRGLLQESEDQRHLGLASRDGLIRVGQATALGFGVPEGEPTLEGVEIRRSSITVVGDVGQVTTIPQRNLRGWACRGADASAPNPDSFLTITLTAPRAECRFRSPGLVLGFILQLAAIATLIGGGLTRRRRLHPGS